MKILIGSNGGLTGIFLAKKLRNEENCTLFGADAEEDTVGRFFVDKQFHLPKSTTPAFVDELIELLNKERIDVYLPTHSKEISAVSHSAERIRSRTQVRFLVSPASTFDALDNKRNANTFLRRIGIPVPTIIESCECSCPVIMKNDIGSGSAGNQVIRDSRIMAAYRDSGLPVSFYEYIEGDEYTLDCMFDSQGTLIGSNQRRRIKTIGGAVSVTVNDYRFDISPWIRKIADNWTFCGCVNFQYIVRKGIPYFIDINLRFPSGGLPLTIESGLNIPKMMIDAAYGKKLAPYHQNAANHGLTMYRYFEELYSNAIH